MNTHEDHSIRGDHENLIGIPALAEWLDLSVHTVKKWCSKGPDSGLVPRMIRVNGSIRFDPADVREWLRVKTIT